MAGKAEMAANTIKGLTGLNRIVMGAGIGAGVGALTADRGGRVGGAIRGGVMGGVAGGLTPQLESMKRAGFQKAFSANLSMRKAQLGKMWDKNYLKKRANDQNWDKWINKHTGQRANLSGTNLVSPNDIGAPVENAFFAT